MPNSITLTVADREIERAAKFKKIAEPRANKALAAIEHLTPCANRRHYYYTERQVHDLFAAFDEALGKLRASFNNTRDERVRVEL